MTNNDVFNLVVEQRNAFVNDLARCQIYIDDKLPYLEMLIRLNQEVRAFDRYLEYQATANNAVSSTK